MNLSNEGNAHAELRHRFEAATRLELETEILSKLTILRTDDAMIFDAPGWGTKELPWFYVQSIVQGLGEDDGVDGLCHDVVAAMIDGVDVVQ